MSYMEAEKTWSLSFDSCYIWVTKHWHFGITYPIDLKGSTDLEPFPKSVKKHHIFSHTTHYLKKTHILADGFPRNRTY